MWKKQKFNLTWNIISLKMNSTCMYKRIGIYSLLKIMISRNICQKIMNIVSNFFTLSSSMQQFPQRKSFVEKQIYLLIHSAVWKFRHVSARKFVCEIDFTILEPMNFSCVHFINLPKMISRKFSVLEKLLYFLTVIMMNVLSENMTLVLMLS